MQATVTLADGVSFVARSGSGHDVIVDGAAEHGGANRGARPMELLLMGLGGCSAFDVVHILRKGRQPIAGCEVRVDAERAETEPRVFTRIRLYFVLRGRGLDPARVERAIRLSAEKYCSASIMLARTARISHHFEILDSD